MAHKISETWKRPLTIERLREVFSYDPVSGEFDRIKAARGCGRVGQRIGTLNKGYRSVTLDGKRYDYHRLVWFYTHQEWPEEIDHIDGNGLNNHISNLRPCTRSQNSANKSKYSTNTSGFKGVTYCKATGKWRASITHNYKAINLGRYETPEKAHAVYLAKAQELFGDFTRA